jgi:hypothetical protein
MKDHFMAKWSQTLVDATEKIGKSFDIFYNTKDYFSEARFVDVVEKSIRCQWDLGPAIRR